MSDVKNDVAQALGLPDDTDEGDVVDAVRRTRAELRSLAETEAVRARSIARRAYLYAADLVERELQDQRQRARTTGHAESAVSVLERVRLRILEARRERVGDGENDDGAGSVEPTGS